MAQINTTVGDMSGNVRIALYGDMVAGLAVIADIYKVMVYDLVRWINREGEVIPKSCLDKPPSAGLRFHDCARLSLMDLS